MWRCQFSHTRTTISPQCVHQLGQSAHCVASKTQCGLCGGANSATSDAPKCNQFNPMCVSPNTQCGLCGGADSATVKPPKHQPVSPLCGFRNTVRAVWRSQFCHTRTTQMTPIQTIVWLKTNIVGCVAVPILPQPGHQSINQSAHCAASKTQCGLCGGANSATLEPQK